MSDAYDNFIAKLEAAGEDKVRENTVRKTYSEQRERWALDWLDRQERARNAAAQASQAEMAASALETARDAAASARAQARSARNANRIAMIALVIAIASIVMSVARTSNDGRTLPSPPTAADKITAQ